MIALRYPALTRLPEDGEHLLRGEEVEHRLLEAFQRYAERALDDVQGQNVAAAGELQERAQCGQAQVAAAYAVVPMLFKMIEERQDQIRFDIGEPNGGGEFTELSRGELEEQHQPIAITGDRSRTHGALRDQVLGEERLHECREGRGLGCSGLTHGALPCAPVAPSSTRTSWRRAPSVPARR